MKIYVQFHDHDGQEVRVSGSSAVMRECVGVGRPPSPLVEIHPVLRKSMTTMTTIDPGEGAGPPFWSFWSCRRRVYVKQEGREVNDAFCVHLGRCDQAVSPP